MKKVYISGPITGVTDYNRKFHNASVDLKKAGYKPVNPCTLAHDHDRSYESYMKEDIKALIECDFIYMLSGWKNSKGAICEYKIADACGIEVLEL